MIDETYYPDEKWSNTNLMLLLVVSALNDNVCHSGHLGLLLSLAIPPNWILELLTTSGIL